MCVFDVGTFSEEPMFRDSSLKNSLSLHTFYYNTFEHVLYWRKLRGLILKLKQY